MTVRTKRPPRIRAIDLRMWRPNEYTVWRRPQREDGIGWKAYVWGCFRIVVHFSTVRNNPDWITQADRDRDTMAEAEGRRN